MFAIRVAARVHVRIGVLLLLLSLLLLCGLDDRAAASAATAAAGAAAAAAAVAVALPPRRSPVQQGLTLVHFSAQSCTLFVEHGEVASPISLSINYST